MPSLPHPHLPHHHEKKPDDTPNLDSKDSGNDIEKINTDYKPQLDEMAHKARQQHNANGNGDEGGSSNSYTDAAIETVSQYVPALGKMLGKGDSQDESTTAPQTSIPGPPERPDHDPHIEDFIRDQHRSLKGDGMME